MNKYNHSRVEKVAAELLVWMQSKMYSIIDIERAVAYLNIHASSETKVQESSRSTPK